MIQENEKVYIGYSFTDSHVQIAYYTDKMEEPELLFLDEQGKEDPVPLAVCKLTHSDRWLYGKEAIEAGEKGHGILVADLFPFCIVNEPVVIERITYRPMELISIFIKKSFQWLREICMMEQVEAVTFSLPRINRRLVADFRKLWEDSSFQGKQLYINDHKEGFYRFVTRQKQEIYNNDVILLEQTGNSLRAWNLVRGKLMKGQPFLVRENSFSSFSFGNCTEETDEKLADILEELMGKRLISTVIMSGRVFYDHKWMKRSLSVIARGRKVYFVPNLFVQGACYRSVGDEPPIKDAHGRELFFMGEHQLHMNVGMYVWNGREQQYMELIKAGKNWYECNKTWEFLVDECDSVCFRVDHVAEEKEERKVISLDWLPQRPNLATKVAVTLTFYSVTDWDITIKDIGLGELFPGTNKEITTKMV